MTSSCRGAATALAASLAALALAYAAPAAADLPTLPPFGNVNISGTTSAAHSFLDGLVLKDDLIEFTDVAGTTTGLVQTRVVRENSTGKLDFYFRILNDFKSKDDVSSFLAHDYTGINPISVDFRTDGIGIKGPDTVRRTGPSGDRTVEFQFTQDANVIKPGNAQLFDRFGVLQEDRGSQFFFVHTNATDFHKSTGELRIGGLEEPNPHFSKSFDIWAPTVVPEPQTYVLLAAGLGLVGLSVRRRKLS
jgi:hypothetical protein